VIRNNLKGLIVFVALLGLSAAFVSSDTAHAAKFGPGAADASGRECKSSFLGFPAWYDGLPRKEGTCNIAMSEKIEKNEQGQDEEVTNEGSLQNFILLIALNVIEIGLRLVGYAAVGFIIYGGFKYLTSAGSADRVTAGRKIILNAIIGLVLSFFSVAIVNLVAGNIQV
jgi:hypothetical protein